MSDDDDDGDDDEEDETNKVPDGTYKCTKHNITDDYGTGKTSNLAECMVLHPDCVVWYCKEKGCENCLTPHKKRQTHRDRHGFRAKKRGNHSAKRPRKIVRTDGTGARAHTSTSTTAITTTSATTNSSAGASSCLVVDTVVPLSAAVDGRQSAAWDGECSCTTAYGGGYNQTSTSTTTLTANYASPGPGAGVITIRPPLYNGAPPAMGLGGGYSGPTQPPPLAVPALNTATPVTTGPSPLPLLFEYPSTFEDILGNPGDPQPTTQCVDSDLPSIHSTTRQEETPSPCTNPQLPYPSFCQCESEYVSEFHCTNAYAKNYYTLSDSRRKENVHTMEQDVSSRLRHLPVCKFSYPGETEKHIGVMAQDVQASFPEAVSEKSGVLQVNQMAVTALNLKYTQEVEQSLEEKEKQLRKLAEPHRHILCRNPAFSHTISDTYQWPKPEPGRSATVKWELNLVTHVLTLWATVNNGHWLTGYRLFIRANLIDSNGCAYYQCIAPKPYVGVIPRFLDFETLRWLIPSISTSSRTVSWEFHLDPETQLRCLNYVDPKCKRKSRRGVPTGILLLVCLAWLLLWLYTFLSR